MIYGLLGEKLGHSYSPQIHALLGSYCYSLFEIEPENLGPFLREGSFSGLNVTIPYKKSVIPFCSQLSPEAEKIGAVNTIVRNADGTLWGYNTDLYGFQYMLHKSGLDICGKKVLVLGSGGAAVTVVCALQMLNAQPIVISRSGKDSYENIHLHKDASVIINATPVGMYPNNGRRPVDIARFPELEGVLELIYNPAKTQLILDAEQRGLVAMNGLWMLVAQAKKAAELFTGHALPDAIIDHIHKKLSSKMQNTILIGMPGCGKSTIGKFLADVVGKQFVDTDILIAQRAGKSIHDIFRDDGEMAFRALETQVLQEVCKSSSLVIATGGGCVTQPANYPLLHQNGQVIWLKRDLSLLETKGRPLSQSNSLTDLYRKRQPLYEHFADYVIENDSSPDQVAGKIAELEVSE